MRSDGYCTWSVGQCVCLSLFSHCRQRRSLWVMPTASQRNKCSKTKMTILLKRRRLRSRNWHSRWPRCVTQSTIIVRACVYTRSHSVLLPPPLRKSLEPFVVDTTEAPCTIQCRACEHNIPAAGKTRGSGFSRAKLEGRMNGMYS